MATATQKAEDDVEATDTPTDDADAAEETTEGEDEAVEVPTDVHAEERAEWLAANPGAEVIPPMLLPPAYQDGTVISAGWPPNTPPSGTEIKVEVPAEGEEAPAEGEEAAAPEGDGPQLPEDDLNEATREELMAWLDFHEVEYHKSDNKPELIKAVQGAYE